MRKQNNFRLSRTKNNILYILSGASLALFAGLTLFPTISESTHAEGDEPEDGITITVNGEVDANLVLFDEGDYKIAKDTVSVSSSATYGYELFLTTDSEAHQSIYLNDDPTSTSVISPVAGTIDEPAALTSNTWGFAIAGQGNFDDNYDPANPDPASRFAIIPTVDDQQAVFENNAATAEDNIDFYYGIKVEPTLEVGEYTTSAEYTATAKIPPLTAKAILGDNKNLNFVYDRNTYTAGDTYTDNLGETTITNVYAVPTSPDENNKPGWTNKTKQLTAVNFDGCFHDFQPTSTAFWFYQDRYLSSITNLANFNTSSVTDMSSMFSSTGSSATTLDLSLNDLDTSSAVNMTNMFYKAGYSATTFRLNLSEWNTSSVTNMSHMFDYAGFLATTWDIGNLRGWDVGNVTDMSSMFENAGYKAAPLAMDLSGWNANSVTNMSKMFYYTGCNATTINLDLSDWDTGSVTNMSSMFYDAGRNATSFKLKLSGWNTSSVTDMSSMFEATGYSKATTWNIGDLSSWNTGNVTTMKDMFYQAGKTKATAFNIGNIGQWNTSSVTDMANMFYDAGYNATRWNIGNLGYVDDEHPGWDTGNVTNMSNMFGGAGYNATTFNIGNIGQWDTGNVTNMSAMFAMAGHNAATWNIGDLSSWNTSSVTNMRTMFSNACYSAATFNIGNLDKWNTSNVTNMSNMFQSAGYYATRWNIGNLGYVDDEHPGWDTGNVTDMAAMFYNAGRSKATSWGIGNIGSWNTSNVTNMGTMFKGAGYNATTWNIGDISSWDVTAVTSHSDFIDLNTNQTNASVVNNQPHWN